MQKTHVTFIPFNASGYKLSFHLVVLFCLFKADAVTILPDSSLSFVSMANSLLVSVQVSSTNILTIVLAGCFWSILQVVPTGCGVVVREL